MKKYVRAGAGCQLPSQPTGSVAKSIRSETIGSETSRGAAGGKKFISRSEISTSSNCDAPVSSALILRHFISTSSSNLPPVLREPHQWYESSYLRRIGP